MNRTTRINVTIIGVIFGLSGITHGCSEALQGNTPTKGFLINAIAAGSSWTRWLEGGEGAFTLIPNFLLTGILAMLVGLVIIIWSIWLWLLSVASLVILAALSIAIWGYSPGIEDMARLLNITLSMVGTALIGFLLAFVAGFARDIEYGPLPMVWAFH